jgi:hypothetical protein
MDAPYPEWEDELMSSGSTPQTQSTTYQLSPEQRQLLNLAMPGVTQFASSVPQRYPGTAIAGFDPSQVAGQEGALGSAPVQTNLGRAGAGTTMDWLQPGALDIRNNPGLQGNIEAATRPITRALTESALPAIRDSAERSGNFGGSRQGIAEGLATGRAGEAIGDTTSKIVSDAYSQNLNAQMKALGLLPQTQGAQTTGDLTTSAVGDTRQALAQALLGEKVGGYNYDQLAPFLQSKEIMSLLSGLPGGTATSTASVPQKNPLTQALGGAATGASLGSALFPGVGTAVGGGIGALLPFL